MNNYCMIQNSKTFAFSAENPTGVRAGGSQGGDCTKLRPTVTIHAGETVTLVDAAGPGVIQHMWFTGYVGHHFIIRAAIKSFFLLDYFHLLFLFLLLILQLYL